MSQFLQECGLSLRHRLELLLHEVDAGPQVVLRRLDGRHRVSEGAADLVLHPHLTGLRSLQVAVDHEGDVIVDLHGLVLEAIDFGGVAVQRLD